jgi:hypothetical protein
LTIAAGEAAREADGAHGRLGAGGDQAHHLQPRQQPRQQFGHLDLGFRRRAESQSPHYGVLHRLDHLGMGVAQHQRAPGADVVDVALAVGVPHIRAFAAREEARRAADRAEGAHWRIDAAGNGFLGAGEEIFVLAHDVTRSEKRDV